MKPKPPLFSLRTKFFQSARRVAHYEADEKGHKADFSYREWFYRWPEFYRWPDLGSTKGWNYLSWLEPAVGRDMLNWSGTDSNDSNTKYLCSTRTALDTTEGGQLLQWTFRFYNVPEYSQHVWFLRVKCRIIDPIEVLANMAKKNPIEDVLDVLKKLPMRVQDRERLKAFDSWRWQAEQLGREASIGYQASRFSPTRRNPKHQGIEVYDPNLEQIRAQRQAIYESRVKKLLGAPNATEFRNSNGLRLDAYVLRRHPNKAPLLAEAFRYAFSAGTSVQQRTGFLEPGSQRPTKKAATRSRERYANPDELFRNRQDYEETLAIPRKSFYRVVAEGKSFFVWPLSPDDDVPTAFRTAKEAKEYASFLNATLDPRETDDWFKPLKQPYTKAKLSDWLKAR